MNDWCKVPFGTLYAEPSRNGIYKPKKFHGSGTRIVNMGEMFALPFIGDQDMSRLRLTDKELEKFQLQEGDLIFARRSLIEEGAGKCALVVDHDEPMVFESSMIRVRLDRSRCIPRFYYYYFKSPTGRETIRPIITGVSQKGIRSSDLKKIEVHNPSIDVQAEIAAVLSAYDDLIENNTRRIAILEEMAQAIYREWFVHFRFPGHEEVEFVETEVGEVPAGWEVVPFTEIADVLSGGTPRTKVDEYWNGAIPFFSPRDISGSSSFYVTSTDRQITQLGVDNCSSDLYPKDTVFITARGTVGKTVLPAVPMAMNQSCYALRSRDGISQRFVFLSIRTYVEELQQKAHGAVFDTIIMDTFRQLKTSRPPLSLIHRFTAIVDPLFDQILNLLRKNENLRQTRDLLLPRLISGELDVSALAKTGLE